MTILAQGHQYEDMLASHLGLAIGVDDLQVLMVERVVAAWEQLQLSWNSNGIAIHAPLNEFGSVSPASQFYLIAAQIYVRASFAISLIGNLV